MPEPEGEAGACPGRAQDAFVRRAYEAYSRQNLDGLLACVAADADWPDGSRRIHGSDALRSYWSAQWTLTRTSDVPTDLCWLGDAVCAVHVSQVVRDLDGDVLSRARLLHVLQLDGGSIARLDIVPLIADGGPPSSEPIREQRT